MFKYFTNKILSQKLNTNLAKWKRWSREFLPPDPLGGMQSGYARQYTPDEAFTVYLGGYLVGSLNFSIPDTRQILLDLKTWLSSNGFDFNSGNTQTTEEMGDASGKHHMIFITPKAVDFNEDDENRSHYEFLIRSIVSTQSTLQEDVRIIEEQYIETFLPPSLSPSRTLKEMHPVKILNITPLLNHFITCLNLDPGEYSVLS